MIRDANFEDLRRAANRRRLVHLVIGCTLLSMLLTLGVTREVSIYREVREIQAAEGHDLQALERRHAALDRLVKARHFWTGAFGVRKELTQLTLAIAELRRATEARAMEQQREVKQHCEEAELERIRGLVAAERGQYPKALVHFRAALRSAELVGPRGFEGAAWAHRDQVISDIEALEAWEERRR